MKVNPPFFPRRLLGCSMALFLGVVTTCPSVRLSAAEPVPPHPNPQNRPPETLVDRSVLPIPFQSGGGEAGLTYKDSTLNRIEPVRAPAGAPNIVIVLLDDVGFGAAGTFGGTIPTPTLDAVASEGLRYNRFHTTAFCSPSRAALLTGRNSHSVGFGAISEFATAFDGYNSVIPRSAATVAEVLKQNGYGTAAFGKWHNTPVWEVGPAGPFDRWPTGMGFEEFYGFMGGEAHQYNPGLFEGTRPIERPESAKDYHLTEDLVDHAVSWMKTQKSVSPDRPVFVYLAPGATHAPHHAPAAWRDRFKGKYDQGWDKLRDEIFARQKGLGVIPADARLTPRPDAIPAWDSLTADQKTVASRLMEVYAGFLAHTDHEVGRLVSALKEQGEWDNTLFLYMVGDNGAAPQGGIHGVFNEMASMNAVAEDPALLLARLPEAGGPKASNEYPVGFAWAMCTPFQWTKMFASHLGGTRNPLVISWPDRIREKGGLRSQFHHIADIMPTLLEAAGIPAPRSVNGAGQTPLDGVSMVYTFDDAKAPSTRKIQYFEVIGSRAMYRDGWMASTYHHVNWDRGPKVDFTKDRWELYNLDEDFSQAVDLSAKYPDKLTELKELFMVEAARNNVFPLDDRAGSRAVGARPGILGDRTTFTLSGDATRIPEDMIRSVLNRSHTITAELAVPADGNVEGVVTTAGGCLAGFSLFVKGGIPMFTYNYFGSKYTTLAGKEKLPPGAVTFGYDFVYDGGGLGKGGMVSLTVNGQTVARQRLTETIPLAFSADETLDVGEDTGTPASDKYDGAFRFNGVIKKVSYELK